MKTILYSALGVMILWSFAMAAQAASTPPGAAEAKAALDKSPRHGEWVEVAGPNGKIKCFVVYPERKEKAPVVIVIHEIYGLSDWVRGVADQLAADGFIAIAPDLLSGKGPNGGGTEEMVAAKLNITGAVSGLKQDEVAGALNAIREYGIKLPAASGKSATIGFCWGGGTSFNYAIAQPELNAAVVYYGTNPSNPAQLEKIKAPILGCYGADDARVVATIAPADEQMKKLGKPYTHHEFEGAGHGFLRQQDGRNGANLKAAQQAWPTTIEFLRENTK
jgi:carboxymethylenebutenolidase